MRISRYTDSTSDSKSIAQFTPEEFIVKGHLGFVHIEMYDENNGNHKYRIALSKSEAIQLITEMYEYLEDDLAQVK